MHPFHQAKIQANGKESAVFHLDMVSLKYFVDGSTYTALEEACDEAVLLAKIPSIADSPRQIKDSEVLSTFKE
jgi:hypothetical protein